jgi:protein JSN1
MDGVRTETDLNRYRAREIQAQEGVTMNVWGPPTSGNSTPLRENIPESPTDGFPDYVQLPTPESIPQARRARAGTVPSRFSPGGPTNAASLSALGPKTSSASPYKTPSPGLSELGEHAVNANNAALLSRLRAGSMPQRSQYSAAAPFGPSVFSTNWGSGGRERTSTLASIASIGSNTPSSPAQSSSFSREGTADGDMQMRTLDYLGLADTPQPPRAQLAGNPFMVDLAALQKQQASRFRSYSVNATSKYDEEDDDDYESGQMTPYEQEAHLQLQLAATNAAIQQHNLAVQAFANQASATRPRARTAGVLESPGTRLLRNYYPTPSRLDNTISASDLNGAEYDGLPEAVQALGLGRSDSRNNNNHLGIDEQNLEGPTRALWLGSIPSSTTVSTLEQMFKPYGKIVSVRVLTHKNCGFVNFENLESAKSARSVMNGKEIFPGAGPVRINFAKPPSATGTPGHDGAYPSPSPDPFAKGQDNGAITNGGSLLDPNSLNPGAISRPSTTPPMVPNLRELQSDIVNIVKEFGATDEEQVKIARSLHEAVTFDRFESEIPPIQEPAHNRVHDAPKLRDIRKRIDNSTWSQSEIEAIAMEMLPEIAELSSDYLGNTVVQKLFEYCSDNVKDAMLFEIAPHMAEIGVHKNGTWAAQKIIDVAKMPQQMAMIVDNLRPYTVPLFLDQYGNYVLQCCLRFGSPFNDFIFETMLSQMWEIAQGRYGARAMRACLESHHSTKDQQRMLAAAVALHSVQLATNANGALLLTWFLDTCTFPQRRTVLAPRLVPHLVHLCTHKVAYLTVLKVINQRNEPEARDTILKALFFSPNDKVLEDILSDHACGATLIFKVLTTPFFDETIRAQVVENVRNVLLRLKAQPAQGYKRLMDEVGLSTRNGSAGPNRDHSAHRHNDHQRPGSQPASAHMTPSPYQYYPQVPQQPYDMQRTDSMDSNLSPYPSYGVPNPMFNPATVQLPPMNMQQLQYQQGLLGRNGPQMSNYYPYGGYNSSSPAIDHYRNQGMQTGSPIQPPPAQINASPMLGNANFAPPGFGMSMNGYGYPMNGMQGMGFMQAQQQEVGRRGRVSSNQ